MPVLVEILALTIYVRYLDIELVLFELLGLTNYVRYQDIELMLFELLARSSTSIALCLGIVRSL
jgi:hypothetical protein